MSDYNAVQKNILSIRDHAVSTRKLFRELEAKVTNFENENKDLKNKLELLQTQLQTLQIKVFSGGATS